VSTMSRIRGWKRISRMVLERDDYICALCGKDGATTVDHIVPRSMGGDHTLGNLRAAHRVCNSRRGAARATLPRAAVSRW